MINKIYIILVALMFSVVITTGCYGSMTGTVVDAETGKPIEGAIVLVEWTKTKGFPGMSHTESAKVIEVISDKDGKVEISGNVNPFADPPHVTVYKKGYVAWNNEFIFPDYKKRTDFKWENGYVYKLEHFKEGVYSHKAHVMFLYNPVSDSTKIQKYSEAIGWERAMMQEEIKKEVKH